MLYNILVGLFVLFSFPRYLGRWLKDPEYGPWLKGRFSTPNIQSARGSGPVFWIQAVSVGEAATAAALITALRERWLSAQIYLSVSTLAAWRYVREKRQDATFTFLFPIDFSFLMDRALDRLKPDAVILMETELWPNLMNACHRRRIPIGVVNGRISDKAFPSYRRSRWLAKPLLSKLSWVSAQDETAAERFRQLGVPADRVTVSGNLKFDAAGALEVFSETRERIRAITLSDPGSRWWVCASTRPGEERICLEVYQTLSAEFPKLRLCLVPRHVERAAEIARQAGAMGIELALWSNGSAVRKSSQNQGWLVDQVGQLAAWYEAADIVFVGGSLAPFGGHNMLEPASFGKPVVVGPHTYNFTSAVRPLLEAQAMAEVRSAEELTQTLRRWLHDDAGAQKIGQRARQVLEQGRGAAQRTVETIDKILKPPAIKKEILEAEHQIKNGEVAPWSEVKRRQDL